MFTPWPPSDQVKSHSPSQKSNCLELPWGAEGAGLSFILELSQLDKVNARADIITALAVSWDMVDMCLLLKFLEKVDANVVRNRENTKHAGDGAVSVQSLLDSWW